MRNMLVVLSVIVVVLLISCEKLETYIKEEKPVTMTAELVGDRIEFLEFKSVKDSAFYRNENGYQILILMGNNLFKKLRITFKVPNFQELGNDIYATENLDCVFISDSIIGVISLFDKEDFQIDDIYHSCRDSTYSIIHIDSIDSNMIEGTFEGNLITDEGLRVSIREGAFHFPFK